MKPALYPLLLLSILGISCHRFVLPGNASAISDLKLDSGPKVYSSVTVFDTFSSPRESLCLAEVQFLLSIDTTKENASVLQASRKIPFPEIGHTFSWYINTYIEAGLLFDTINRYAVIRQNDTAMDIMVYKKQGTHYKKALHYSVNELNYCYYTIKDVNNDGHNDLLVYSENYSGFKTCEIDFVCDVFLCRPDGAGFQDMLRLKGPVFFIKRGEVYGIHLGEEKRRALYKAIWNGTRLDTAEVIIPHPTKRHRYIIQHYPLNKNKPLVVKEIPVVYQQIPNYFWFEPDEN